MESESLSEGVALNEAAAASLTSAVVGKDAQKVISGSMLKAGCSRSASFSNPSVDERRSVSFGPNRLVADFDLPRRSASLVPQASAVPNRANGRRPSLSDAMKVLASASGNGSMVRRLSNKFGIERSMSWGEGDADRRNASFGLGVRPPSSRT